MDTSSYIKLFNSNAHAEWQGPRFTEISQGNGLAEMLQDLDDETLRKIFRMQPPLMVEEVQRDEGPPIKNNDRRHNGREAAVGRPPQMKKVDQRHNERRASMTIDDQQCSLGDQQCKERQ